MTINETQAYFGDKIGLSVRAIQKLNSLYGERATTEAMRLVVGFPPPIPIRNHYSYLEGILRNQDA